MGLCDSPHNTHNSCTTHTSHLEKVTAAILWVVCCVCVVWCVKGGITANGRSAKIEIPLSSSTSSAPDLGVKINFLMHSEKLSELRNFLPGPHRVFSSLPPLLLWFRVPQQRPSLHCWHLTLQKFSSFYCGTSVLTTPNLPLPCLIVCHVHTVQQYTPACIYILLSSHSGTTGTAISLRVFHCKFSVLPYNCCLSRGFFLATTAAVVHTIAQNMRGNLRRYSYIRVFGPACDRK